MSRNLTASDKLLLLRLASTLPVGSVERKAILAEFSVRKASLRNPEGTKVDVNGVSVVLVKAQSLHGAFDVLSSDGAVYGTIVPGTGTSLGRRGPTVTTGWVPYDAQGKRLTAPTQALKKNEALSRIVR